ncbi:TIGR01244 family phosphatase [Rhodobacterales bacterium HKCCE3408]|nr:TIGR01244 family phosphatase [Rhodobacterales bacterium HKCCE3408]
MNLRPIAEGYSVSSQLAPDQMADLAASGVKTVICNRPDTENPQELQAAAIQAAAEAEGMAFVYNPVIGTGMSPDAIDEQADAIDGSDGPVVAYCASGMRSALMWALSMAGRMPTSDILKAVAAAGYPMDHLSGQIDGIGQSRR